MKEKKEALPLVAAHQRDPLYELLHDY